MSAEQTVVALLRALDGPREPPTSLPETDVEHLAAIAGHGAVRWVTGTVDASLSGLRERTGADLLAPWPQMRILAEHVLAEVIADAAEPGVEPGAKQLDDRTFPRDIVARGIPSTRVVQTLRSFQDDWLAMLVEHAVSRGGSAAVFLLARAVTRTIDGWVDAFLAAIADEQRRTFQSEQARVRAMVETLLGDDLDPGDLDDAVAASALGTPLSRWHLACAIGAQRGAMLEHRDVDAAISAFERAAGTSSSVRYATSGGVVWAWVSTEDPVPLAGLEELRADPKLVIGVGEPRAGLAGFRRSHLEALDALRLASEDARPVGALYRDVALETLVSRDEERAAWFAEQALGDLAAHTEEMAELRRTLRVFFDTRMRIAPAADLLFIHRNTLISRLEKAERMLGHRIGERTADTQTALLILDRTR